MAKKAPAFAWLPGILTVALGCTAAWPATAGSLQFAPIIVELPAGQHASILEVTNRGEQAASVQIQVFAWSQVGDEDRLEPTADLVVSPPAANIPAGEAQTIRLILHRGETQKEGFYRLQISELPAPGRPAGVAFLINASLPVFVMPAQAGHAELSWRAEHQANGQIVLVARNAGDRQVRIGELTATLPSGVKLATQPLGRMPYVLPGVERRWRLQSATSPPLGTTIALSAVTMSSKPETATVSIAPPQAGVTFAGGAIAPSGKTARAP